MLSRRQLVSALRDSYLPDFELGLRAAAIGFPVIIMLLLPLRIFIIPRLSFTGEELSILDGPTASSFVSLLPLTDTPLFNAPVYLHPIIGLMFFQTCH